MHGPARGLLLVLLSLAVPAGAGAAPAAAATKPPRLPTLLATGHNAASGQPEAKRFALPLLDPRAFRVVRRPSAASVTLGWPAAKPCAFTTFTLSLLPKATDADAAARAVVPVASFEGSSATLGKADIGGNRPTLRSAWRQQLDLDRRRLSAVAVWPLLTANYGDSVGGFVQLRAQGRAVPNTRCTVGFGFELGPNITDSIIVSGV